MKYRFEMVCPGCGRTTVHYSDKRAPSPEINCGDCLMDRTEIQTFKVVKVTEE